MTLSVMTHQDNSRYYQPQGSSIIPFKRANALGRLVPEFRWDGDGGLINDFDDFGDSGSDFIEPGARWGDIYPGSTQAEWEWWENYSDGW
jgi:hypothetical protein